MEPKFDRHNYTTTNDPYEREISSLMEHELGHLVAPAGREGHPIFGECVAEAFSFIRQEQEYTAIGEQLKVANYVQSNRLIISGDESHFFVPVLTELQRLSETHHIPEMKLT